MAAPVASASPTQAANRHLVLYDGVCGFCHGSVRWLIDRDPEARLQFAPLQGETAAALRARHSQIPSDLDTMVYVVGSGAGERVYLRSDAVLRVGAALGGGWKALRWLLVIPAPLRDLVYRGLVRMRYRLFGELDECRIPAPAERERFLD